MSKKERQEIPIMFCFDKNYVIPAAVTFYSILEHANKDYYYHFYVLHSDITGLQQRKLLNTIDKFKDIAKLDFINMENRFEDIWDRIYKGGHFAKEVMYKILIASIFPQYDKIIVTDVDVVFLGDLAPSYIDFNCDDDYYIAGVRPIGKVKSYMDNYKPDWTDEEIKKLGHICGGYLVANLKKIREDDMEEVFINSFIENGYRLNQMEQDILNICCYPKIKYLPLEYVACSYMWDFYKTDDDMRNDISYSYEEIKNAMENPIQLHYATSIKPWKNVDCTKSEEWFRYITLTPFLREYLESLPEKIVQTKENALVAQEPKRNICYRVLRYIKHHPTFFMKKDFYYKVLTLLRKKFKFLQKKEILYICDDFFPSQFSSFRYEEFLGYWNAFNDVQVLTSNNSLKQVGENKTFDELVSIFLEENKKDHHKISVYPFPGSALEQEFATQVTQYKKKLAVVVFLNNLINGDYGYLNLLEKYQIPFVFTLYPGGGFALNREEVDVKLQRVFNSPMFRKVIVTQEVTKEYLLKNNFCSLDKIEFIYGGVVPKKSLLCEVTNKKYYSKKKETLDICFVAYKYMKEGKDKGYDLFIEVAKNLCKKYDNIKFHVVGTFDESDIDVTEIKDHIIFYGPQPTEWFDEFYKDKDILLSPNRPNQLVNGAFDGFPTTCAIEAMLHKVMLIATDGLKQNIVFKDKKDLVLIELKVSDIVKKIEYYYQNPEEIKKVASSGYEATKENYSIEKQVSTRIDILKNELEKM